MRHMAAKIKPNGPTERAVYGELVSAWEDLDWAGEEAETYEGHCGHQNGVYAVLARLVGVDRARELDAAAQKEAQTRNDARREE
jgi:hypothetical protein